MVTRSHDYKIFNVSDEAPPFNILNVTNKNPSVFWRTSNSCAEASFEIKFTPEMVERIEVQNILSPQIQVEIFNKDEQGNEIDRFIYLPKVTLITRNDFMEGRKELKTKKFDSSSCLTMVIDFGIVIIHIASLLSSSSLPFPPNDLFIIGL